MHKHLNARFVAAYILLGLAAAFLWIFVPLYTLTTRPTKAEVQHTVQRELGDLNTERVATAYLSDQAAANDIHVVSIKKLKVIEKDANTLVYRFKLVGISDIYGKLTFVIDVTVKKGVYTPAGLKVISSS